MAMQSSTSITEVQFTRRDAASCVVGVAHHASARRAHAFVYAHARAARAPVVYIFTQPTVQLKLRFR
jgi:hypothetical protein